MQLKGGSMRKRLYYLQLVCIYSTIFIILFESLSLEYLIAAPLVSAAAIFLSEKFLLKDSYYELYYFNLFFLLRYTLTLIKEIYVSSFKLVPIIFSGSAHPAVVSITTELENPLNVSMVANSITLTPGTITIDVSGHRLLVLWIEPKTKEPTIAGKMIKGQFESLFKEPRL